MRVCSFSEILNNSGVCALVGSEQVAVFRVDDEVYAVGNHDPFSKANVLSRGIVGDLKGELVVASPVYKQHFSLKTGRCLEDASVRIPVYSARVEQGFVEVEPAKQVKSTCCYCGVGCGIQITATKDQVFSVQGDPTHPANFGRLCTKGASLHLSTDPAARLLYPEVNGERASWDEALDYAAQKFRQVIAEHGPDAVAFYISGQLLTEDYYVFNKLVKGLIGTNNVDTNSRLCMSSAVAGYKMSLGADAPPCAYDDIDAADLIMIAGSNTAFAHPVLFQRIENAKARVIVIDPRATVTARAADLHLQLKPGTDIALFNAMLHVLRRQGLLKEDFVRDHTEGFSSLDRLLNRWTPERAAEVCELPAERIVDAALMFGRANAALSLYCQGLNQSTSGTWKNCALINLHLATGQIGRPGAGPFSLTGQPNAMGGREVGGMANLLSAHRDLSNPSHRAEVARLWGVRSVPERPGKTAVEMFDAVGRGEIKAIWIACTNPAQSMPDVTAVRKALERAEIVVVQDAFRDAETCAYADVLLPASTWAEKEGTVTNSERRISRVRAAVPPPGEARHDWQIAVDFARRLQGVVPAKAGTPFFEYRSPEEIFNEHRETTRGRDLDITGLTYAVLERDGPQQWPYPDGATGGQTRLYMSGVFPTPSGRARFVATDYVPPAEEPDAEYPLRLTTGRLRDQWHSMTRTGLVPRLFSHSPAPEILLHKDSMRGIEDGSLVRVTSRRGSMVLKGRVSDDMRPGDAFIAMHWGARFAAQGINALTLPVIDPFSKQPELKHAAIRIEPFDRKWGGVFVAPADLKLLRDASTVLAGSDCAALGLVEGAEPLVRLALAESNAPGTERLAAIEDLFGAATTAGVAAGGPVVCACFNVGKSQIVSAVASGASLAEVQKEFRCGTNCGSCLPELRTLVEKSRAAGCDRLAAPDPFGACEGRR
jgi:assimilatory nitrate reductase catalytic subunit